MSGEEKYDTVLNIMKKLKLFTFATKLENADREILKEILTEVKKVNDTLEQILKLSQK